MTAIFNSNETYFRNNLHVYMIIWILEDKGSAPTIPLSLSTEGSIIHKTLTS